MSATIGRRRLDMTADRIEATLAGHKITAQCWGGRAGRHSAVFHVTVAEHNNPAAVVRLGEELALSLGMPVLLHSGGPRTLRVRVFGL